MNALVLALALCVNAEERPFTDIEIEPPFREVLLGSRLLMETTGAKVIKLPDGRHALLGVASTVLKDDGPAEIQRAEMVCPVKALRSVVATTQGVQIVSVQRQENRLLVTVEQGKQTVKSVAEYFETTTARVEGIARGMAVVGKWRSADGKVFYLAMGMLCDRKGEPVGTKPK